MTGLEQPLHKASWAAACEEVRPPLLGAAVRRVPELLGDPSKAPAEDLPHGTAALPAWCTDLAENIVPESGDVVQLQRRRSPGGSISPADA